MVRKDELERIESGLQSIYNLDHPSPEFHVPNGVVSLTGKP